ncbi:TetR/AcrR family transcriptional regulator [Microlunatus soli]|uniref:DNA-binding transcriptional regulator, AcrR family n=1 Tax=Microlunatus soli TaxID=630515 RepID=A0A1H1Q096_9ACTN|nr:TetR/AcrR family transcriptional regulator [Microlunatus soli]SDS16794.1 DNA-binding transcriptional regulator, AcrR family [Microlunatus soli]
MTTRREPAGAAVLQESVTVAISAAMFDQLAEGGYARMSMEAVARSAGVGKAAVYRRWPSKQAMVVDLIGAATQDYLPEVPDTGSLVGDARGFLELIHAQVADPRIRRIALDVLVETSRNRDLEAALHDVVDRPRRIAASTVLTRAIDRGELAADIDLELGLDLLIAPLLIRLVRRREPMNDAELGRLTDVIVAGLRAV